jgi:hypothetical protein
VGIAVKCTHFAPASARFACSLPVLTFCSTKPKVVLPDKPKDAQAAEFMSTLRQPAFDTTTGSGTPQERCGVHTSVECSRKNR